MMTSVYFTGYKPFELNIFKNEQPEVKVIKAYLKEIIEQEIEEGMEWVIISGQLGFELWAAEVTIEMKNKYPQLKLAILTPFLNHYNKWNETNQQAYHNIVAQADYVNAIHQSDYQGGFQFQQANEFILDNTEKTILFYDDEQEASPKYFKSKLVDFAEKTNYTYNVITFMDLHAFMEFNYNNDNESY
ncbi:SLOG family protein [Mammaliicoccus sciuri]|uniref:SLOG family protein n=1 Tax=Mammaliicoccus sciuri TaxID=1296 RepID=UPI001F54499A|nr:SLOG family protein [Mammaliicoccus sciuri]